jgi:hypothetical protein
VLHALPLVHQQPVHDVLEGPHGDVHDPVVHAGLLAVQRVQLTGAALLSSRQYSKQRTVNDQTRNFRVNRTITQLQLAM